MKTTKLCQNKKMKNENYKMCKFLPPWWIFYESKDMDIDVSYMCTHPYSSIKYHKFSLKVNEIIHQKWSFVFGK
jgi:hypothetical protein